MKSSHDAKYINAFNLIPGIGPQKLFKLSHHFASFKDAWHADKNDLISANLSEKLVQSVIESRRNIDIDTEWKKCEDESIILISVLNDIFPEKLKHIPNPPFCLYVRGNINALNTPCIAIVGSRKISEYGTHATRSFSTSIGQEGVTIVSGLALGTDAIAHKGALEVSGVTIGVLAGGIDNATITPRTHTNLAQEIITKNGMLISEYPCKTEPNRGTFPVRNRLMAGLSDAVVIIEATQKSGTLITAEYAKKYNKPLFALPGSIFSDNALGPNTLIQSGEAKPVLCSNDILRLFDKRKSNNRTEISFADKIQEDLYKLIKKHPNGIQINTLIKKSKLDTNTISGTLILLEIDKIVQNIGNQTYIIKKN